MRAVNSLYSRFSEDINFSRVPEQERVLTIVESPRHFVKGRQADALHPPVKMLIWM
jgi:hypothetical protein